RRTAFLVVERRDQVLHARALRVALLVADLAHLLDAADLHALELLLHHDLPGDELLVGLVVPDLHLHAPVPGTPFLGRVRGDRLAFAPALVGDRLGRQPERLLEELGRHAGTLAREAVVGQLPD